MPEAGLPTNQVGAALPPHLDITLCDLQTQIYADPVPGRWDNVFGGMLGKVGHVIINGVSVVCFPGSKYGMDWIEDAEAIPFDPGKGFGTVSLGMFAEVLAVKQQLDKVLLPRVVLSGHSLGAIHALILAAWFTVEGRVPEYVLALAPPQGSYQEMWEVFAKANVRVKCCWNSGDIVPELPEALPLLPWTPSPVFTRFNVPAAPNDNGRFRYHHLPLYCKGIALSST